ncbi:hypothetical protein K7G98_39350, partial [Saccharothrix sp. MB29]|nr:hypothetical protein [Saccharothrix sp. MB29]
VPVDTVLSYDSLAGATQFGSVLLGSVPLGPATPGSDPFGDAPFEDAPFGAGPFGAEVLEGSESESGSEAEHDGFSGYTFAGRADNAMPAPAYE